MELIYISGPYRADTEYKVLQNIRRAEDAMVFLMRRGYSVICPHKNTAHLGGVIDTDKILEADFEQLSRCDIVFMLVGWSGSVGASAEHKLAEKLGKKIVYDIDWFPNEPEEDEVES